MANNDHLIHQAIRQQYGAIAMATDTGTSCCASPEEVVDCSCAPDLYNVELLEGLSADVTNLSLGCGDPVTITNLQPGESVLDLGSGGGIDCFLAARQVGDEGHIIGVDMTPQMIAKANTNKNRMGITNVEFREGQIEALPVEDAVIDVVMSNCVINLSPDKPAVFREAFRVLKPGGRVSISDIVTEGEFGEEARARIDAWVQCITGAIDVNRYIGMMRDAGFVDITVVDKQSADDAIGQQDGTPRIYSARITARKPA